MGDSVCASLAGEFSDTGCAVLPILSFDHPSTNAVLAASIKMAASAVTADVLSEFSVDRAVHVLNIRSPIQPVNSFREQFRTSFSSRTCGRLRAG